MEHSIKIEGTVNISCPDIVKAASILAKILTKDEHSAEKEHIVLCAESLPEKTEKNEKKDFTSAMYQADGSLYTLADDMMKAIDSLIANNKQTEAQGILMKYSTDGTGEYRSIKPADWSKIINEAKAICKIKCDAVKQEDVKEVTLEDCRAVAAKISKAGGKDTITKVFLEFGAKKLSEIPADKYSELLSKLLEVA